ncbi:MAG: hypothetical protein GY851_08185 [bacterium]|nr:hypothetical protein [bacterium]
MRIALVTWNGRISPVLDVARHAVVHEIDDGQVASSAETQLPGEPPLAQETALQRLGVNALLCGAVSRGLVARLRAHGMEVVPFLAGDADAVLTAYLAGRLPDPALTQPGCRGQGRRFHGRRGRGGQCRRRM